MVLLSAAAVMGCGARMISVGAGTGGGFGTDARVTGSGARPAGGSTGAGGAGAAAACAGAADPRLLVAGQRIFRLTSNELLNTVRFLVGETEAAALIQDGLIARG